MDSILMRLSRFHRKGPAKVLVGLLVFTLLFTAYHPMAGMATETDTNYDFEATDYGIVADDQLEAAGVPYEGDGDNKTDDPASAGVIDNPDPDHTPPLGDYPATTDNLDVVVTATINGVPFEQGMTAQIGDAIAYSIAVTNTGNVEMTDILIEDPMIGLIHSIGCLAVGETSNFTGSLVVTKAHWPFVYNLITVTAHGVTYEDAIAIPVSQYTPDHFTVTYNIGSGTEGNLPYDTKEYQMGDLATVLAGSNLTNDNRDTFAGWQVRGEGQVYYPGSLLQIIGDMELVARYLPSGDPELNTLSVTYTGNYPGGGAYTTYQASSSSITFPTAAQAMEQGLAPHGYELVSWTVQPVPTFGSVAFSPGATYFFYFVTPTPQLKQITFYAQWQKVDPSLSVVKTATINSISYGGEPIAKIGDVINYTISVTNTGRAALYNILVEDSLLGLETILRTLCPGSTATFTGSMVITAQHGLYIENEATASIDGFSFTDKLGIPVAHYCAASLEKTATINGTPYTEGMTAKAGDVVEYTVYVTNLGNVELSGLVADSLTGLYREVELQIDETIALLSAPYTVSNADYPFLRNEVTGLGEWAELVIPVEYTVDNYRVTYHIGRGTTGSVPTDNNQYSFGDIATVLAGSNLTINSDYIFAGWQIDGEGEVYFPGSVVQITGDMELVARYLHRVDPGLSDLHITYVGNYPGGGIYTTKQSLNTLVTILNAAQAKEQGLDRAGYNLLNWTLAPVPFFGIPTFQPGATYYFHFMTPYPQLKQLTFYAQWEEAEQVDVPELTIHIGAHINGERYVEGMWASVGDEVHYSIIVVNTGNVDLTNVLITEPTLGLSVMVDDMVVEDYAIYEFRYEVLPEHGLLLRKDVAAHVNDLVFTSTHEIPVLAHSSVYLAKRATINGIPYEKGMTAQQDDVVFYILDMANKGNVDLSGVVDDPMVGFSEDIYLPVGWELSVDLGHHIVTANDGSHLHNTAYAFNELADLVIPIQTGGDVDYYSVTYLANGGEGFYTDYEIASDVFYVIEDDAVTGITFPRHRLVSWNTSADGSGVTFLPGDSLTLTSDLILYAQWERLLPNLQMEITAIIRDDHFTEGMNAVIGDTIYYTTKITNTGDVAADGIYVYDSIGFYQHIDTLDVGATETFAISIVVQATHGLLVNYEIVAIVENRTFVEALEIPVQEDRTVIFEKTASHNHYGPFVSDLIARPGDTIIYRFAIANLGNVEASGVLVDPMLGIERDLYLDPTGSTYIIADDPYLVTAADTPFLINTATYLGLESSVTIEIVTDVNVTYHANGGYGEYIHQYYSSFDMYPVQSFGITGIYRYGYRIDSWNTEADGSGTTLMPNDSFYLTAGILDLYAQWTEADGYTITFYPGSGTWIPDYPTPLPVVVSVKAGELYTIPSPYQVGIYRRWWHFDFWSATPNWHYYTDERYFYGQEIQITEDLELYAQWFTEM